MATATIATDVTHHCCACEELKQATSSELARQAAATIREAATECGERTRELLLLSRPHAASTETIPLDVALRNLSPKIPTRLRSNVVCEVDAQVTGTVRLPPSWFEQIAMNLLLNAEQAMPTGGKVCISSRLLAIKELSLRRLLLNLVANARDACAATGGHCNLSLRREHAQVVLEVSDNGCGMDATTKSHLFEPFFSTKGPEGTGLGLHSVAKILETTDATVDVWSEPDEGTRLTMRWPLAASCEDNAEELVPLSHQGVTARILFAEDEESVRRVLARGLRRSGFTVVEARDGDEAALFMESQAPFDALCTDAVMPGMQVAELIRGFNQRFPGKPVLVISGYLVEPTEMELNSILGLAQLNQVSWRQSAIANHRRIEQRLHV